MIFVKYFQYLSFVIENSCNYYKNKSDLSGFKIYTDGV